MPTCCHDPDGASTCPCCRSWGDTHPLQGQRSAPGRPPRPPCELTCTCRQVGYGPPPGDLPQGWGADVRPRAWGALPAAPGQLPPSLPPGSGPPAPCVWGKPLPPSPLCPGGPTLFCFVPSSPRPLPPQTPHLAPSPVMLPHLPPGRWGPISQAGKLRPGGARTWPPSSSCTVEDQTPVKPDGKDTAPEGPPGWGGTGDTAVPPPRGAERQAAGHTSDRTPGGGVPERAGRVPARLAVPHAAAPGAGLHTQPPHPTGRHSHVGGAGRGDAESRGDAPEGGCEGARRARWDASTRATQRPRQHAGTREGRHATPDAGARPTGWGRWHPVGLVEGAQVAFRASRRPGLPTLRRTSTHHRRGPHPSFRAATGAGGQWGQCGRAPFLSLCPGSARTLQLSA